MSVKKVNLITALGIFSSLLLFCIAPNAFSCFVAVWLPVSLFSSTLWNTLFKLYPMSLPSKHEICERNKASFPSRGCPQGVLTPEDDGRVASLPVSYEPRWSPCCASTHKMAAPMSPSHKDGRCIPAEQPNSVCGYWQSAGGGKWDVGCEEWVKSSTWGGGRRGGGRVQRMAG